MRNARRWIISKLCDQGHYVAEAWVRCLEGHELSQEVMTEVTPMDVSQHLSFTVDERIISMADEMTYNNGYHYVRDDDDNHDGLYVAAAVHAEGDANRDVADAGRDLTSASADANRDLINANADANRDLMNAIHSGDQHGQILSAIGASSARVTDNVNEVGRDLLREAANTREEVAQQGKENLMNILDQGSRGRETTLAQAAEVRNDIADAHTQNLLAHCETQKLVIKEHCETREAVREEGVRTRDLVAAEARAAVEREMARISEENTLLKLQINILGGGGPLSAK